MAARVARHMSLARASILVFIVVALLTALFMVKMTQGGEAAPQDNIPGVPHYFGPWTNWALSPLTLPDATVTINGDGTGATATATVGGDGAVTGITITNPGSGYTAATVTIDASPGGTGAGAAADAVVTLTGIVTGVTVDVGGAGYTAPVVSFSGGGATTQATGTAYGGVDALTVTNPGFGYQFPTVGIDAPDDPNGTQATAHAVKDDQGVITAVVVDDPGSGYAAAPNVVIRDGTLMDPVANAGAGATATATLAVSSVTLDTFGAGYMSAPTVSFRDGTGSGSGASATGTVDAGGVTAINLTANGSRYVTGTGIRKFVDELPGLYNPLSGPPTSAKYIPLGVPEEKTYGPIGKEILADEYEIALVQYRTSFSSSLKDAVSGQPVGTLVRGYVQLETPSWLAAHPGVSQSYPLTNELLDGTLVPIVDASGNPVLAVTPPQWLGPTIAAEKNKPVRIVFHNLLPTGAGGDLFLPTDSTLMGSGTGPNMVTDPLDEGTVLDGVRNPVCTEFPKSRDCFKDNRATLHLHGGTTPWISDGTPHQWITPAGEDTPWPEGVDVMDVPDMEPVDQPGDGVQTFYYTNQQSARLLFYHDHAWGITRLNVYAGEAAGYLISDDKEKALVSTGTIPADQIPLVVQDRTFVPDDPQLRDQTDANGNITSYGQDPTWDKARWGGYGNFWYHHVYMPAQNPGDPGGMSAYGRWMYGPWFWPPAAATKHGPIANPYYDAACNLDDPATWQYDTDPFCEPQQIPGTPNISAGMEQFNDTPIVNGVAYPTLTLEPKTYRLRVLNAANDRFFNFQWYVADPTSASTALNSKGEVIGGTEVALNAAELAAAQTDPVTFPTPAQGSTGPDWIQIGTEGGFLPAPVVVDGQQETTWITDPTRFDVGNVDQHSLLLAPAERADVIVDFSQYAGQTLILYNDAPAAFPARVPSYDYYTGQPDLSPNGAPGVLPGYGPNTRTVMQVKIAGTAAPVFNLTKLRSAFSHKADGSGVFESSQHPIIVGQAAYNSAYGTNFAASGNCNAVGSTLQICDGFLRVNDTQVFGFNTLRNPRTNKMTMPVQPKAIHDEMNSTTFDEFGRMQANLGVEAQPPTPGLQNVTLYPFVNPVTEFIDGTNLPKNVVVYDANGNVQSDVKVTPISDAKDGTQIWRVTHNGVDTHPIHFHLYDVQILNRVTWDNIIIPPDATELGWKDTVRMAPLEDTIVALRPIVPQVPWEVPNAIKMLNPMDPAGSTKLFNNIDPQGNPTAPITNQLVNYGWGYVWHCHILSHEEMDMMRPQSLVLPPVAASGLQWSVTGNGNNTRLTLTFQDNSIIETSFDIQRMNGTGTWATIGTLASPLDQDNIHEERSFVDTTFRSNASVYSYRVVAKNTAGYLDGTDPNVAGFPEMTAQSVSDPVAVIAAPSNLTATLLAGPQVSLTFTDNAGNEAGFVIQRSTGGGPFVQIGTAPARNNTGSVTFVDPAGVTVGSTYTYRVAAVSGTNTSAWSNAATVAVAVPAAPSNLTGAAVRAGNNQRVTLNWTDNANNESGFTVERSTDPTFATGVTTVTLAASTQTYTTGNITRTTWYFRVRAVNVIGNSAWATVTVPPAP